MALVTRIGPEITILPRYTERQLFLSLGKATPVTTSATHSNGQREQNTYARFEKEDGILSVDIDSDTVTVYNKSMSDTEQPITLEELARLVDLPVRTIRYYITEGLLPGPGARGKAALYGEEHLLKLRLIRRLSERRMPLAEMQALLPRLSLEEVRELLEEEERRAQELERSTQHLSAKDYLERLLKNAQAERQTASLEPSPTDQRRRRTVPPMSRSPDVPSSPPPAQEAWHRWELAPGVELHIRSDAESQQRSLIERLFKAVGMIFQPSSR